MVTTFQRLFRFIDQHLFCNHPVWSYIDTVEDQNLRTGHRHLSQRYRCAFCGKVETRERPAN